MIFVMEPVAVPNHFLSQHYFGLPWGPERRANAYGTHVPIQLITEPFPQPSLENNVEINQKQATHQRNSYDQAPQIKNTSDIVTNYSPYRFLLSNYSQSAQPVKTSNPSSYLLNPPRKLPVNKPNVHRWHHWRNSTEASSDKVVYSRPVNVDIKRTPISGLTVGSDRLISRNTGTDKAYNTTGSAKSVEIKDLRL